MQQEFKRLLVAVSREELFIEAGKTFTREEACSLDTLFSGPKDVLKNTPGYGLGLSRTLGAPWTHSRVPLRLMDSGWLLLGNFIQ